MGIIAKGVHTKILRDVLHANILRIYLPKEKKKLERRSGGKTLLKSGLGWTLPAQLEHLKTGTCGKGSL